jgi:hypothetical protein
MPDLFNWGNNYMVMFIDREFTYQDTEKEKTSQNDQATFGHTILGEFINQKLQMAANTPSIWKAFRHWSTLDESVARSAVRGGTLPWIIVEPDIRKGGDKEGCFKPWLRDYIFIGRIEPQAIIDPNTNPLLLPGLFKSIESTILHELVHWGRNLNQNGQPKFTENGERFDVGTKFEKEAYPELRGKYSFPAFMPTSTSRFGESF